MAAVQRPAVPLPRPFAGARPGRIVAAALVVLLVGAAALQVNQFSRLTSTGYEIDALERQRAALLAENHDLEAEVASLSSLARVDWEARTRLKLEPARRRLYVPVNVPAPERNSLPTRFLPQPVAATESGEASGGGASFLEQLRDLLPF